MGEPAAHAEGPAEESGAGPKRVGGRYELGELLGVGGMAVVRLATDLRLGRPVAVKMLRGELAESPAFQARFRREARAAAALNHPAVVGVYDAGEDIVDGAAASYIVMEYVPGQTLRQLIRTGPLDARRALEVTAEILDALACSHLGGVIHRDIKPANVMVTPDGAVKVMDFGVARAVADISASLTQTSTVIGTAHYLSPEQARGDAVDARSDLYSTGCLLYELMTGRPPFQGDSAVAVAYQHVREPAEPPSTFAPGLPPEIDAVVLAALAKNPDERYQSAEQMRADVLALLAGAPVVAPVVAAAVAGPPDAEGPASTTQETPVVEVGAPAGGRRRRVALLASAAAVLLLAALGAVAFTGLGDDPQVGQRAPQAARSDGADQGSRRSTRPASVDPVGVGPGQGDPGTEEQQSRRDNRPAPGANGAGPDVREIRDRRPAAVRPEPTQAPEPANASTPPASPEETAPEEDPTSEPPATESPEPEPSTSEPAPTTTAPAPEADAAP